LIGKARPLYAHDPIGVDLDQSLYALDSTTIDLCLSLFPWARFRLQVLKPGTEKNELCARATGLLVACAQAIRHEGIAAEIVSTGGAGTYYLAGNTPGVTEVQAGCYLVTDTACVERGAVSRRSLTLLAIVISARNGSAVLDCGVKAISGERGLPCLALRHQLGVLQRSLKRPQLTAAGRLLWAWLSRVWADLGFCPPGGRLAWNCQDWTERSA
jgi:hypothetical protein